MTTDTTSARPFRPGSEILADLDQHGREFAVGEARELRSSFRARGLSRIESQRIAHLSTSGK